MAVTTGMPVLIVDDYNTMVRVLRNLLRQFGFTRVEEASDGRTALDKMRNTDYQLVISDWNMEGLGGAELLRQVRSVERCRSTPIVMVTTGSGEGEAAGRAGADGYILKPFTAPMLRSKLASVLGAF